MLQLLLYLHIWWSLWGLRHAPGELNFFSFIALLLGPAVLFLSTQVLLFDASAHTDSKQHYFRIHRIFFTLIAVVVVWEIVTRPLFFGETEPLLRLQLVVLVVLAALATSKSPSLHGWLAIASWVLFLAGAVGYGLRLTGSA